MDHRFDLAIVGAGLSAISALRAGVAHGKRVVVFDYQEVPGGFLRSALPAPGFEDAWEMLHSWRVPPEIAAYFSATVVGLLPASAPGEAHTLLVRTRAGTEQVYARHVLIACGGLEATREHAQIPGTRPGGVFTPILVHQFLARGYLPGKRAIVYGDSRYATATARRLADAGVEVTQITPATSEGGYSEGQAELVEVLGFPRVEGVRLRREGQVFDLAADTLIYAAGMIANTHWLRGSGIVTTGNGAIQVNARCQTNIDGIFAVGTVVAPSLDHASSIAMGQRVAALLNGGSL
jgi:thioredoxin reductase